MRPEVEWEVRYLAAQGGAARASGPDNYLIAGGGVSAISNRRAPGVRRARVLSKKEALLEPWTQCFLVFVHLESSELGRLLRVGEDF